MAGGVRKPNRKVLNRHSRLFAECLSLVSLALASVCPCLVEAAPCSTITLRFYDRTAWPSFTREPSHGDENEIAWMQLSADGSRTMRSRFWDSEIHVTPVRSGAGMGSGELYAASAGASPPLAIELQAGVDGRTTREIVRGASLSPQSSLIDSNPVQGWYQYKRDELGRIREIVHYFPAGPDGTWFTEDDVVSSRVEIGYHGRDRAPRQATIFQNGNVRGEISFAYDSQGRLLGGTRKQSWTALSSQGRTTAFSVIPPLCLEIPERLVVILLSPSGGPWRPFGRGFRGDGTTGAR